MRTPSLSLPSVIPYSSEVTLIGLRILPTILALIIGLIMGPLLASELLNFGLFLIIGIKIKNQDPQVTGMRTGQSSCIAPVGCQVLRLFLWAMDLNKALKLLKKELLLEV